MVPVMFTLYTIVERLDGASEIVRHGTYATRAEAEQIGENLRLLYGWVKSFEVRDMASRGQEAEGGRQEAGQEKPEKKMTGSVRRNPVRKRKSS